LGLHLWNPCMLKSVPYMVKYMISKGLFQQQSISLQVFPCLILSFAFIARLINLQLINLLTVFSC
jgi:hypothetical protein